jgi:hypothetical protein
MVFTFLMAEEACGYVNLFLTLDGGSFTLTPLKNSLAVGRKAYYTFLRRKKRKYTYEQIQKLLLNFYPQRYRVYFERLYNGSGTGCGPRNCP